MNAYSLDNIANWVVGATMLLFLLSIVLLGFYCLWRGLIVLYQWYLRLFGPAYCKKHGLSISRRHGCQLCSNVVIPICPNCDKYVKPFPKRCPHCHIDLVNHWGSLSPDTDINPLRLENYARLYDKYGYDHMFPAIYERRRLQRRKDP